MNNLSACSGWAHGLMGWHTISPVRLQGPAANILQCVVKHNKGKEGFIFPYLCAFPACYGQCDDNTDTKAMHISKEKLPCN